MATESHYERRRRAVHERILVAAVDRFEKQGIERTKVDDICAVAQVAQKTFFNHFATKQDVVREIAALFLEDVLVAIDDARAFDGTTAARLSRLFGRIATEAIESSPMRRSLVIEVIRLLHGHPAQAHLRERLQKAFAALLRDGVRAGDVTSAHPPSVLAGVVGGSFYALMLDWVSIDGFPIRTRARTIAAFLGDALAPRPTLRSRGRASN